MEDRIAAPENVTHSVTRGSGNPTVLLCWKDRKARSRRDVCPPTPTAVFPTTAESRGLPGSARDGRMNTTCSTPARVGGTQTCAATWADLEDAPLSETSPSRKDEDCRTPIDVTYEGHQNVRGSRMAATGAGGGVGVSKGDRMLMRHNIVDVSVTERLTEG